MRLDEKFNFSGTQRNYTPREKKSLEFDDDSEDDLKGNDEKVFFIFL